MNARTTLVVLGLLVLSAWTARPVPAQEAPAKDPGQTEATLEESANKEAYRYNSAEGGFQVTWPSGCGKLQIRENDPENFVGEDNSDIILVHVVVCDRYKQPGDGCAITATFEAKNADGGPAGPEQVLARVKNALKVYGVKIVRQAPIKREFEDNLVVEGVDVFGTNPYGEGQFWVRGLLSYHDIYLLTAWSMHGNVWDDPEYIEFFNGFVPYAE